MTPEAEDPTEPSASVLTNSHHEQDGCDIALVRLLPAETVEFSVSYASEESMPFVGVKSENRSLGVSAVTHADTATGQVGHLDAGAVGEAKRTLNPARTGIRPLG